MLLSPSPFEDVKPLKDAKGKNENLAKYVAATKELAASQKTGFVDVFAQIPNLSKQPTYTENGVHFNGDGYSRLRRLFHVDDTADTSETESLRAAIVAKNELFFHRWRPQNETYLFGFRKHEQGKNGKEIAEFDPLVAKEEVKIAELRKKLK